MAAGIAYTAFVSLAPMLLLLLIIVSLFGGGLETQIVNAASDWLPRPVANIVHQLFAGDSAASGVSVIGLLVLVWGTLKIFRGLDTAFSEIYETEGSNSFFDQVKDGVIVLVALFLAILATVGVSTVFVAFVNIIPPLGYFTPFLLFFGLMLAFYPIYYFFPDTEVRRTDVLPGVIVAAFGWAVLQVLFQIYLLFKDPSTTNFFGSVIVVVTYLYFLALILLTGAVINAVLGGHSSGMVSNITSKMGGYETKYEQSLNSDELTTYLQSLQDDLTGSPTRQDTIHRPPPMGTVTIRESYSGSPTDSLWAITIQWPIATTSNSQKDVDDTG